METYRAKSLALTMSYSNCPACDAPHVMPLRDTSEVGFSYGCGALLLGLGVVPCLAAFIEGMSERLTVQHQFPYSQLVYYFLFRMSKCAYTIVFFHCYA